MATEYTTDELAAALGVAPATAHRNAQQGLRRPTRRGPRNVFSEDEVAGIGAYRAGLQRARPQPSDAERFWRQVEKTESHWLWRGKRNDKEAGVFAVGQPPRGMVTTHRWAWAEAHAPTRRGRRRGIAAACARA